jgi:hypothetical protein
MSSAMPDSPKLLRDPNKRNRGPFDSALGDIRKVSTNTSTAHNSCLAAPPRDVGRLLEHYGTALPRYLDVHRWRDIETSQQRWPLLRHAPTKDPAERT